MPEYDCTRITERLKALGMSMQRLADITGNDRRNITRYISGDAQPSLRHAIAMSHALKTTVVELFPTVHNEVCREVLLRSGQLRNSYKLPKWDPARVAGIPN